MTVGDIEVIGVSFANGQIEILLEQEVLSERTVDGDVYTTTSRPLRFAYIDRRTVRTGTLRGFKFDQGTIDEQYLSADPDNPTWHDIRPNMRRFFPDDGGISGGFTP
jgi:hypothetical protein